MSAHWHFRLLFKFRTTKILGLVPGKATVNLALFPFPSDVDASEKEDQISRKKSKATDLQRETQETQQTQHRSDKKHAKLNLRKIDNNGTIRGNATYLKQEQKTNILPLLKTERRGSKKKCVPYQPLHQPPQTENIRKYSIREKNLGHSISRQSR